MSSDVRIVDFDPKVLLKLVDLMHRSMASYMSSNTLAVRISPNLHDPAVIDLEIVSPEPHSVGPGDLVLVENTLGVSITVMVNEPTVFGISAFELLPASTVALTVSGDAVVDNFRLFVDESGTGGTTQPIEVKPPTADD